MDLRNQLEPFTLASVRPTGVKISAGAYGTVEEVEIPGAVCAAKKIHDAFHQYALPDGETPKAVTQFVKECQLMSSLRHPNIVQFLGIYFFPGEQMPAIVMEKMLTSLHELLENKSSTCASSDTAKASIPLDLKCSILQDVASGLFYLHEQSPPIIHRDLTACNVLLNSGMVAKIADLGTARLVPCARATVIMSMGPGTLVYTAPEAMDCRPGNQDEKDSKSKYDSSIDIFSFGVVAIFTLCQSFPCDILEPTYFDTNGQLMTRTELERRQEYIKTIHDCEQLSEQHVLLQMIAQCLDVPRKRPNVRRVLQLIKQARAGVNDELVSMNKLELIQAQLSNKVRCFVIDVAINNYTHVVSKFSFTRKCSFATCD